MDSLKVEVSLPDYISETIGLLKFSIFSGKDISFYSWFISLDEN